MLGIRASGSGTTPYCSRQQSSQISPSITAPVGDLDPSHRVLQAAVLIPA